METIIGGGRKVAALGITLRFVQLAIVLPDSLMEVYWAFGLNTNP